MTNASKPEMAINTTLPVGILSALLAASAQASDVGLPLQALDRSEPSPYLCKIPANAPVASIRGSKLPMQFDFTVDRNTLFEYSGLATLDKLKTGLGSRAHPIQIDIRLPAFVSSMHSAASHQAGNQTLDQSLSDMASTLKSLAERDPTRAARLLENAKKLENIVRECPECTQIYTPPPPTVGVAPSDAIAATARSLQSSSGSAGTTVVVPICSPTRRFYFVEKAECVSGARALAIDAARANSNRTLK